MGIYRTYFSANTTLSRNNLVNTARNPVTELWYGGVLTTASTTYNRFIFRFDTSTIRSKYVNGTIMSGNVLSHKLHMTNTGSFDNELLGDQTAEGRSRASDYDIELWRIPTGSTYNWTSEGVGYDFDYGNKNEDYSQTNVIKNSSPNWIQRTSTQDWPQGGIYSSNTPSEVIQTQNFPLGNENISMDITETVEILISGGNVNNGFGLSFSGVQEIKTGTTKYTTGYFTRHTNTIWSPYIETTYSGQTIVDDRKKFYIDKTNRLFLYTNKGKDPVNLDSKPSQVTIYDEDDTIFSAITGSSIVHMSKGVYYVDVLIPNSANTITDLIMYRDTWSGVTLDNISLSPVEMEFTLKDPKLYYNFGNDVEEPAQYGFSFYGIKEGEKIKKGDIRKVFVPVQVKYNPEDDVIIDGLKYRLYVKQGRNEVDIISWTDINRGFNKNYLTIDTSWLFQHTYYLQLKLISNDTEITQPSPLRFEIVENL